MYLKARPRCFVLSGEGPTTDIHLTAQTSKAPQISSGTPMLIWFVPGFKTEA